MKKRMLLLMALVVFYTCDDIIEVVDISEETITVLAPKDETILIDKNVSFNWNAVEDADSYRLQVAIPNFETAQQILIDSLVTKTVFNKTLDSGSYEWRVRAENSAYETSYLTQKFTVIPSDPVDISNKQVVLLSPADDSTFLTTDTINFSWESISGAENYTIQIATPNFENAIEIINDETVTTTSFSVSNLSKNNYEWRVKAVNSDYETGYATLSFVINEK